MNLLPSSKHLIGMGTNNFIERICKQCGQSFTIGRTNQTFCNKKCTQMASNRRSKIRIKDNRIRLKKACPKCQVEFTTINTSKVFCSKKCWTSTFGPEWHAENYKNNKLAIGARVKKYVTSMKDRVFNHYGGYKCACPGCLETNPKFMTIDHINNDGAEHRRNKQVRGHQIYSWIIKSGFPPIFQILCYNCNCGKNVNGGICPHMGVKL